jgi:hypothetical protein
VAERRRGIVLRVRSTSSLFSFPPNPNTDPCSPQDTYPANIPCAQKRIGIGIVNVPMTAKIIMTDFSKSSRAFFKALPSSIESCVGALVGLSLPPGYVGRPCSNSRTMSSPRFMVPMKYSASAVGVGGFAAVTSNCNTVVIVVVQLLAAASMGATP